MSPFGRGGTTFESILQSILQSGGEVHVHVGRVDTSTADMGLLPGILPSIRTQPSSRPAISAVDSAMLAVGAAFEWTPHPKSGAEKLFSLPPSLHSSLSTFLPP